MEITVLKAAPNKIGRLRVAAYCRVSTDSTEQEMSIENQISYYEGLIKANPEYVFAGIYHDRGFSGFSDKRPGFQQMMEDARAGTFDQIITKSITRFARNTGTVLKATRELKELGIGVFFELQNINTLTESGELMLTVLAAFAQAESETYSTLGKLAYKRKYEAGIPVQHLERSFGYRLGEKGEYEPDPKEAPWVKRMFELCADGYNLAQIARFMNQEGITTKAGASFSESTVKRILMNEIYKGDYLMHKHYVNAERREVPNRGEVDAWYVADDHVPLVSHKLWARAQEKLEEKRKYLATGSVIGPLDETTYPYMNRVFCAKCGYPLVRRVYSNGNRVTWECSGRQRFLRDFCEGINVPDSTIRSWGEFSGNIYINKETDDLGKTVFKHMMESTWKKTNKKKKRGQLAPELTEENYPYKKHLFCKHCGSRLTRHMKGNGNVTWICSRSKHRGTSACPGVRVPDNVVRSWGDITSDIFIERKDNKNGERGYVYSCKAGEEVQKQYGRTGKEETGGRLLQSIH